MSERVGGRRNILVNAVDRMRSVWEAGTVAVVVAAAVFALVPAPAIAEAGDAGATAPESAGAEPADDGEAPAAEADPAAYLEKAHRGGGPETMQAAMTMALIDASGDQTERKLQIRRRGTEAQLVWFEFPADLRGTAFLRVAEDGDQKMWLYLPAFKKLERIGGAKENRSFLGSDFTYADMAERRLERYSHSYLGAGKLDDGTVVHRFESTLQPGHEDAPYGKIVTYVGTASGRVLQEDLYDRKGDLVKRKLFGGYKTIGGYTVPTRVEMVDVQRDHRTVITLADVTVDETLDDSLFTTRHLKRLR